MTARTPIWIDAIQVSGQDLRLLTGALLVESSAGPLNARSGVRAGTDLIVAALGTPAMSVNVGAGSCYVTGTESFAQGTFVGHNDGTVALTVAAADATNPRNDLVIARFYGETVSTGSRRFALEIVTGSAAPSPVDPSLPANSITLARLTVAAGATSITGGAITDLRAFTVASGGKLPCLSTARPSAPYPGQTIFEIDTLYTRVWDGTTWALDSPRTTTARTTAPPGGTTSGTAELTVVNLTLPSVPYATKALITAAVLPQTFSVGTDTFDVRLYVAGTLVRTVRVASSNQSVSVGDAIAVAASTATVVELRVVRASGSGTVPISANSAFTYISTLITPA